MAYIKEQIIAHKNRRVTAPAIAYENFAIVIRPQNEIFEDCEAYQILHKDSGLHVATFSIAEPAIECLQELERVAGFCGKIRLPLSKGNADLIDTIVSISQYHERSHPEYWEEEEEECHY
ncbi:MAG: hypothetical protein HC786_21350 [Richelia sp. CSU_2_1]|nr:hypothetical protein [Microcoleus sp. SU_5_6]NJR24517.1 hypothetical protein [Richelia sp. CSU_2_1]